MNKFKISSIEVSQNNVKSAQDALRGTPRENKNVFDKLPELIVERHNQLVEYIPTNFYNKKETEAVVNSRVKEIGASDMAKAVYDKDNNGVVDNSQRLGGQLPEYYAKENSSWGLSGGIQIENGTDLNTITDVGNYSCVSRAVAESLKNSPTNEGFELTVIKPPSGNNALIQIVSGFRTGNAAKEYRRYGDTGSTSGTEGPWTFGEWRKTINSSDFNPVKTLAQNAMPKSGGTFTSSVLASGTARKSGTNGELRNVRVTDKLGTDVSTSMLIFERE